MKGEDMSWEKIENHLFKNYSVEGEDKELCNLMEEHDKEIRAKAIDEFAEKITLEISKNFILSMLANYENYGKISDKIVYYVIETSKKIAEQMKAGGKNE